MARKPLKERFNRKIIQVGKSSLCITPPMEYFEILDWEKGQEIKVSINENKKQLTLKKVE